MVNLKFKHAGTSITSPIENTTRKEIRVRTGPPRIAQIVFLDGGDRSEANSVKQYVNATRSVGLVDGTAVPNLDRLGRKPVLKVRFNKSGNFEFTVKCEPASGNAIYTPAELARNPRFGYQKEQKTYKTDSDGTLVLPLEDFFVSAAGKAKYVFRATDANGATVSTGILEAHRLVYYIELKMRSLTSCAPNLSLVDSEYAKHSIKLMKLPAVEMDYMPNIGTSDEMTFLAIARKAYSSSTAPTKQPFVVTIVYTGHLAVKKANQRVSRSSVPVGPGCPPALVIIMTEDPSSVFPELRYLWQGLVPGEEWLVSAKFLKQDGSAAGVISIPTDKCTAVPSNAASPHRANAVRVDVSGLPPGVGTVELCVNVVDRMRAGLSFSQGNLICVCTQAWWSKVDSKKQNQTIIHELGHKMGMVSDGTGKLPDKTPSLYDGSKGHIGNHCYFGLPLTQSRYDGSGDLLRSKCVMYGAANGRADFCIGCAPVVCKLDLGDGWRPF